MKIAVNGADGRMGRVFCAYCEKMGIETVGIDPRLKIKTLSEVVDDCDVVVDFSDSGAVKEVCDFVSERKIPAVIATTGFCDGDLCRIRKVAEKIPVFLSANLSRGAAFLLFAMKKAEKFFPTADIEIIETHHSGQTDSPSGTALRLATSRPDLKISVGRNGKSRREKNEIGIHSVRRGSVIGEHEIFFSTDTETVSVKHTVSDRLSFAEGALCAAEFIIKKTLGIYGTEDLFEESFS